MLPLIAFKNFRAATLCDFPKNTLKQLLAKILEFLTIANLLHCLSFVSSCFLKYLTLFVFLNSITKYLTSPISSMSSKMSLSFLAVSPCPYLSMSSACPSAKRVFCVLGVPIIYILLDLSFMSSFVLYVCFFALKTTLFNTCFIWQ